MRRAIAAVSATLLAAVVAVFGVAGPAQAVYGYVYPPDGIQGRGFYSVDYAADTMSLRIEPGALGADKCLSIYVDPARAAGAEGSSTEGTHYDIRVARSCKDSTTIGSGLQYEGATYGVNLTGINRLSVCYGDSNKIGLCRHYRDLQLSGVNPVAGNMCARFWTYTSVAGYYSGGKPTECYQ